MRERSKKNCAADGQQLRILAIHRYYWPDTPPYASMLRSIVSRWIEDGHKVDVLSSQPSYKRALNNESRPEREQVDGADVHRLNLPPESGRPIVRIRNALKLCAAILSKAVIVHRYDTIIISTSPPIIGGATAALAAKITGARFVYHCMDIHPEIGRISGEFRNPLVYKVLRWLDTWSCRQADPVVVLSEDMAAALSQRPGGESIRFEVINNFSLPSEEMLPAQLPLKVDRDRCTVLFAGNLGRFQGLDTAVEAMSLLKERDDVEFVMMGEGAAKASLERKAKELGVEVTFVGHQSVEMAKAVMREVDLGFVSLIPELFKFAYPSKTMTYLEQSCPLLVSVEAESCLALDVLDNNIGLVVESKDAEALARAIAGVADNKPALQKMKQQARQVAEERFSENAILPKWSEIVLKG